MRVASFIALCVAACSASGGRAASSSNRLSDRPTTPAVASRVDLATCSLALRAYELGAGTLPSAPVRAGDGFVVAHTRFVDPEYELVTRRVDEDGVLAPPTGHGGRPGPWVPLLAGRGDEIVLVTGGGKTPDATRLDPMTGAPTTASALTAWPSAIAIGPRGLVTSGVDGERRTIHRMGAPDVEVASTAAMPIPDEQFVASGDVVDVVLVRSEIPSGRVVSVVVLVAGAATPTTYELFRTRSDREFGEVSLAAARDGFVIVRGGPSIEQLEVYRLDARGQRLGEPVTIAAAEHDVARYPRAAALASGYVVTYWDGTGPTLVRLDASAHEVGERIPLRSGDERGGHTDARIAVSETAIAVSWLVAPPMRSHGRADETPKRPGPRLGILTCGVRSSSRADLEHRRT